jgi:threonine-phosphate decarboxylase
MNLEHGGNLFAVARERGWDWHEIADFSASINPLGPSPRVLEAIRGALDRIANYPEREPVALREALGREWGIDPDCILLGNGATELIHFLARSGWFSDVTLVPPIFSEFHRAFRRTDFSLSRVGRAGGPPQASGLPHTDITVLTQPVNPTGQVVDLKPYLDSGSGLLVDESFVDFTGHPSIACHIGTRPNLYVLRSLTKFYALPGLRIGALLASAEIIRDLRKDREPWQVNVLAEQAALAAIGDREHSAPTIEFVRSERCWLGHGLAEIPGAHPQPSSANYLLVALDYPSAPLVAHLLEQKILVRDCTNWPGVPFPSSVRVAVRTRGENERLLAKWKEYSCAL